MKITIKARFGDAILFEGEYESTKHAVVDAVAKRVNLRGSDLRGSNLLCSDLRGSNLRGSNLSGSNLRGSDLSYSNLSGSDLSYSDLRGSNLRGSDLRGSNLLCSDLSGSDLRGSNLSGSNLRGSDLSGRKLLIPPMQIIGLRWDILITPEYMQIDCERHTHSEWKAFKRTEITPMADKAWDWWKIHKPLLTSACEVHRSEHAKAPPLTADELAEIAKLEAKHGNN